MEKFNAFSYLPFEWTESISFWQKKKNKMKTILTACIICQSVASSFSAFDLPHYIHKLGTLAKNRLTAMLIESGWLSVFNFDNKLHDWKSKWFKFQTTSLRWIIDVSTWWKQIKTQFACFYPCFQSSSTKWCVIATPDIGEKIEWISRGKGKKTRGAKEHSD